MTDAREAALVARLREWASSWIETWRVAPPFSARRRRLIALANEPFDLADYIELERPDASAFCQGCPDHEACSTGYPCEVVKDAQQRATTEGPAKPYPGHYRTDRKGDDA